jgi:small-conductance mechanosensitive channel
VSYDSDLAAAKQALSEAADGISWRSKDHETRVLLTGFGDSAVKFDVSVWTQDAWNSFVARSELLEAIWQGLRRANVSLAYVPANASVAAPTGAASAPEKPPLSEKPGGSTIKADNKGGP